MKHILTFMLVAIIGINSNSLFSQTCCDAGFRIDKLTDKKIKLTMNSPSDPSIQSVRWAFGNGKFSKSISPSHVYDAFGTYMVTLQVNRTHIINGDTLVNTCTSQQKLVLTAPTPKVCVANFNFTINKEGAVRFSNLSTIAAGNSVVYHWTFSNGTVSNNANPLVKFAKSGLQSACLNVVQYKNNQLVDSCKLCKQFEIKIPVDTLSTPCYANFYQIKSPNTVYLSNITKNDPSFNYQYYWSFGDGNSSNAVNAWNAYQLAGTYNICLSVMRFNKNGLFIDSCMTCQTISINQNNTPTDSCNSNFSYNFTTANTIQFTRAAVGNNSGWYFDDGSYVTTLNPTHTFANTGTYNVCHVYYFNNYGDSCTTCKTITVFAPTQTNAVNSGSVFPNPSSDYAKIEFNGIIKDLELHNINNQLVKDFHHIDSSEFQIPVYDLNDGVYWASIHMEDGSIIRKSIMVRK